MATKDITPRQYAFRSAIDSLQAGHDHVRRENPDNLSPRRLQEALRHLAKLHNDMLDRSGLDGLHI